MAWLTRITADAQVEYRLRQQAGCAVVESSAEETVVIDDAEDGAVDYRLRSEGGADLVWMGSGLGAVGLAEGEILDEEGKNAARRLMNGCHPETGARLITARTAVHAHPKAQLTTARVVEAIMEAAEKQGVEPAALLEGKPKQQHVLERMQRMVHRQGERHRMQVETLHKLVRAADLSLADIYGEQELTDAWTHKDMRVDSRVRGWDFVFDLPKSDSILQGLMGLLDEQELRALVHQAQLDTFRQIERWCGYAVGSEDGEPVRLAVGGLLAWSVEHQSARPVRAGEPGDPHLHRHVTIANLGLCEDGEWRSIANSGKDLHAHASAADAYFKARVRALLYERFGVRRERNERTGAWEVVGIPAELRDAFSRRAALVDEQAGADAGRQEKAAVSMATKRDKLDVDATTMRAAWRQRAEALGIDIDEMLATAAPGPPGPDGQVGAEESGPTPRIPPPADLAAVVFDPRTGLTKSRKSFSRAELLAAVANALPYGIDADPDRLEQLADQALAVDGYAVRVPSVGSAVMSSTARYTTQDILDAEDAVRTHSLARFNDGSARLSEVHADKAIEKFQKAAGWPLSEQQNAVVTRLMMAGHGIEAVVGAAGAGKSTLMEVCRIGWDLTGTTYAGACLSAVAAQSLYGVSGIPSKTIAAWLGEIENGEGLRGIDVLCIDEATMVDDRAAAALMAEAARTGTKIVAIGDHLQLQAIGPGGWFREVHRLVHGLTLTENRRQEDAAERAALDVWRTGDHEQALQMLAAGGRVHAAETADEARSQILTAWDELRKRWPEAYDLIANMAVLAARNSDVDALNIGAQQIRRAAGELGTEHRYALPGGDTVTLAVGDAVRVRANDYRLKRSEGPDLLNGYRAVITAMDENHNVQISWRMHVAGAEEPRYESAWMTPERIASGALSLGYAMTIAASQGLTCDTSLLYGHGANAFAAYPGITRAKQANHLWLPLAVLEDERTQARLGAARSEKELLQRAIAAFAQFLGQSRPDGMISDLLYEPSAPAQLPLQHDHEAAEARADMERKLQRAHATRALPPSVEQAEHQERKRRKGALAPSAPDRHTVMTDAIQDLRDHSPREVVRRIAEAFGMEAPPCDVDEAAAFLAHIKRKVDEVDARLEALERSQFQVSDEQKRQLARMSEDRERLAIPSWKRRPYGDVEDLAQALEDAAREADRATTAAGKAAQRFAELTAQERSGGQSRGQAFAAEVNRLLDQADTLMAAPGAEQGRVGDAAWEVIRSSDFAAALGEAPEGIENIAIGLAETRAKAARLAHDMDKQTREELALIHGRMVREREAVQTYEGIVTGIEAEMALRNKIMQRFLPLHHEETDGRRKLRQQQRLEDGKKTGPHEDQAVTVAQNLQQIRQRGPR
ncbi:MobF family relaxase [Streptomyces sp. STR69]|uniref:MobF family relaxase n=1 Tax=Streptomyces sp. STR69 TaxID=1796942 RepID=UPI0021C7D19A|nr:MobF family relaxase [Streptomyces sp. STR69]